MVWKDSKSTLEENRMLEWQGVLVAIGVLVGLCIIAIYDRRIEGFQNDKTPKGKIWQYEWTIQDAKEVCPYLESTLNTAKYALEVSKAKPQDENTSRDISFSEKIIESYTQQMKDFGCERL